MRKKRLWNEPCQILEAVFDSWKLADIKSRQHLALSHNSMAGLVRGIILVNSFGAEAGIFWEKKINIMAADDLATGLARSSAAMIWNMWNEVICVICKIEFQQTATFHCSGMM